MIFHGSDIFHHIIAIAQVALLTLPCFDCVSKVLFRPGRFLCHERCLSPVVFMNQPYMSNYALSPASPKLRRLMMSLFALSYVPISILSTSLSVLSFNTAYRSSLKFLVWSCVTVSHGTIVVGPPPLLAACVRPTSSASSYSFIDHCPGLA